MDINSRKRQYMRNIEMPIDPIEEQLVKLLGQDARQSSEKLAKQLNISAATVRRKIKKLVNDGSLSIVGVVDPARFGLPLGAVIALDVTTDKIQTSLEKINERPEVKWVVTTTGRYDIIAGTRFSSLDALSIFVSEVLAKLDGVTNSETFIILNNKKGHVRLT